MDISENYWVLITRVLSNEASSSEKEELKQWLNQKPKNRELFEELSATWNQEVGDISFLFDSEAGLKRLRSKIKTSELEKQQELTLQSRRTANFNPLKIAASIVLLIGIVSAFVTYRFFEEPQVEQKVYATTEVEQRIVTLPDGSEVRLNTNSRISFPEGFAGTERTVELQGEAFFDVEEDPDKPFRITSGDAEVKVLGTSFSVKEQPQKAIMVVVEEGLVSFRHQADKEGVKLREGSLGLLQKDKTSINIEEAKTSNYFSWMNGELSFDKMPLKDVMLQLERIYGIKTAFKDSSLTSLQLTAHTNKLTLEEVLNLISQSLGISYQEDGDTVTWMENPDKS